MTRSKPAEEVLLRRETYGGFIFHPKDATFVHLDPSGFAAAAQALCQGQEPEQPNARELLSELRAAIPPIAGVRYLDLSVPTGPSISNLYSAPTLVDFQITESCDLGCPQCYASAHPNGRHVSWEDARLAFSRMRDVGVCQVAIGGGEPLRHPRLRDILAEVRANGMVPNVTTTGVGMTQAHLTALADHCGAVALSLEGVGNEFTVRRRQGFANFQEQVKRLLDAGINLVLQITLSADNCDQLPAMVEYAQSIETLYGVIFLAHKPAGRGKHYDSPLASRPFGDIYPRVLGAVQALRGHTQVGFDCCLTPLLAAAEEDLRFPPASILEGCSSARGSLGLTVDLDCIPCTFLPDRVLGNLRRQYLLEIWHSLSAEAVRISQSHFLERTLTCGGCRVNPVCLGGCPVWTLVGCRHSSKVFR